MARVVHFEIPADDVQRAVDFYRNLFGWTFEDANVGMPYMLATTGDDADMGINGAIMPRGGPATGVVNTTGVESIDATLTQVKELGGDVLTDVMDIPGVGRFAYCRDPEGNTFGVIEPVMP